MKSRIAAALAVLFLASSAFADANISFWNRTVWKAAQSYPLDSEIYTGWGPDWQGGGAFHQMSIAFDSDRVSFLLDTQFNASADFKPHINAVQASAELIPSVLKTTVGKLKIDDYRISTPFMDKGMGRIQLPDDWLAPSLTLSLAGLTATAVLPSYAGSASQNINASATGPNAPAQQTLKESVQYTDFVASYEFSDLGLKLTAGTFGDTSGGMAYGSTGTDMSGAFGTRDPKKAVRSYFGGVTGSIASVDYRLAATYWGAAGDAPKAEDNLRAIAGLNGTVGSFAWTVEGLADYRSAVKSATVKTVQIVNGTSSSSYSIEQGPLTGMGFVTLTTDLKSFMPADLVAGLTVGGGTQDLYQGNGLGSYSLPQFDRFIEVYPSLTIPGINLKFGFDYKYDLSAGQATWVVPISLTLSS